MSENLKGHSGRTTIMPTFMPTFMPTLALALSLGFGISACWDDGDMTGPVVTVAAALSTVPAPLARELTVTTDEPSRVTIDISDGMATTTKTFEGYATSHSLPVLGLKFNTTHDITVTLEDQVGNKTEVGPLTVEPISPPEEFPTITKNVVDSAAAEPGVLFLDVHEFTPLGSSNATDKKYLVAIDNSGDVVWYFGGLVGPENPLTSAGMEIRPLDNGNLLVMSGSTRMIELDMLGNVVTTWVTRFDPDYSNPDSTAIKVDTDTVHHDMVILPNGNFLVIGTAHRCVDNVPTTADNTSQTTATVGIVEDPIIEFDPATGAVVKEWTLLDAGRDNSDPVLKQMIPSLDPSRVGFLSLLSFWDELYEIADPNGTRSTPCGTQTADTKTGYDWGHGNGLSYDPSDNGIVVSYRHQDAVIKFDRETNELRWILGPHDYWNETLSAYLLDPPDGTPASFWNWHEHAPMITSTGTVMVFNNHNFVALPPNAQVPASDNDSGASEYKVTITPGDGNNPATRTVSGEWEFRHPTDNLYTPFVSDVDEQPQTGNILVAYGAISVDPATGLGTDAILRAKTWLRPIEVTHDAAKSIVYDVQIGDSDISCHATNSCQGWYSLRAEKLTGLYR